MTQNIFRITLYMEWICKLCMRLHFRSFKIIPYSKILYHQKKL